MSENKQALYKKLEIIQQKEAQIMAQLRDLSARERSQERKKQMRRILLLGRICKNMIEEEPNSEVAQKLIGRIHEQITSPKDRELFGLPALDEA